MGVNWGSLGSAILGGGSPAGPGGQNTNYAKSGMDLLMGMFANKGQQDQQNKLMASNAADRQAGAVGDIYARNQNDTLARDMRYMDEAKLGWDQNYLQKQMAKNIAMQQLMGGYQGVQPTNEKVRSKLDAIGWKPFVPQLQDGWDMSIFSKDAAQAALGNRQNDLSMLAQGRNALANWATPQNQQYAQSQQQAAQSTLKNAIDGVSAPYTQAAQQQKSGGNIFGKILKGVGAGLSFIPGVGQIAAPIATFAGGMVNGDGFKRSLGGAALSAVPMGLGKLGGAIGGSVGNVMQKVSNPFGIGGAKLPQQIGQQAMGGAQSALQNAIGGMGSFYGGGYRQPQGQMNLPSRPMPQGIQAPLPGTMTNPNFRF